MDSDAAIEPEGVDLAQRVLVDSSPRFDFQVAGLVCSVCERTLAIPTVRRWLVRQGAARTSLFSALIELLRSLAPSGGLAGERFDPLDDSSNLVGFALGHLVPLLCVAAFECRFEVEAQGQMDLLTDLTSSSLVSAWATAIGIYEAFLAGLSTQPDQPFADRTFGTSAAAPVEDTMSRLLPGAVDKLVRMEAAQLQAHTAHPQQALDESLSQRLLRECAIFSRMLSALEGIDADADAARYESQCAAHSSGPTQKHAHVPPPLPPSPSSQGTLPRGRAHARLCAVAS